MGLVGWVRDYALSKGYYKPKSEKIYEPDDSNVEYDDEYDDEESDDRRDTKAFDKKSVIDDGRTPFSVIYNRKERGHEPYVPSSSSSIHSAKVYPFAETSNKQTIYITYPTSIDECRSISDYVRANNAVFVNLENIKGDISSAQRIVDFLAGVVYTVDGDIQNVSNKVFLLVPKHMDIEGSMGGIRDDFSAASIFPTAKAASFS